MGYLPPRAIDCGNKLENALHITTVVINNHGEKLKGYGFNTHQPYFWHLFI